MLLSSLHFVFRFYITSPYNGVQRCNISPRGDAWSHTNSLAPPFFNRNASTKPGKCAVTYTCAKDIDIACFYNFSIRFRNEWLFNL